MEDNDYFNTKLKVSDLIKADITATGIIPPNHIEFSRRIKRFSDNGKKNKNGWYIAFYNPNNTAAVAFGNWKGIKEKRFYNLNGRKMLLEDKAELSSFMQKAIKKFEHEKKDEQASAAIAAKELIKKCKKADPNHYYFTQKQIKPFGVYQLENILLIPIYNYQDEIISVQRIFSDGRKRFLPKSKVKGGSYVIGDINSHELFYMCEGYATGATLHHITNKPIVLAFSSNNLPEIAQIYRDKYPEKKNIIAADNDISTKKRSNINPGKVYSEKAAQLINAEICICPIDSVFNDLYINEGEIAVKQALKKKISFRVHESEPLRLEREYEKAKSYPVEALGEILANAAMVFNKCIQAPDALCAHSVLGFAAHTVQGHANIEIDGRIIPLNEYFLSVGSRSVRKSECDLKAGYIHKEYQHKRINEYQSELSTFFDQQKVYEEEKKKIISHKKYSLVEKKNMLSELRIHKPNPLYEPTILISDPTVEGIHSLFLNGTPSKYLCADEGGQVSGGYSMTTEKKIYSSTTYSKYWDGVPIDRVRGGDGFTVLYGKRLSLHLMMQDRIAFEFMGDEVIRNQGLLSRFLISYPESLTGNRHYRAYDVPDTAHIKEYYNQIYKILEKPLPLKVDKSTGAFINELEPKSLLLEKDAKRVWVGAYEAIEIRSGKGRQFESIEGFAGKASNHILRLAGILAMFDGIDRKIIPKCYIENAIKLIDYYLNERLRLNNIAKPNTELSQAKKLLSWVIDKNLKILTLPDVYQYGPSKIRNKQQALKAIKILEDHLWLKKLNKGGVSEFSNKKSNDAWSITNKNFE